METQYRKEKEEADLLLEQHRLVGLCDVGLVAQGEPPVLNLRVCSVCRQRQRRRLGQALLRGELEADLLAEREATC